MVMTKSKKDEKDISPEMQQLLDGETNYTKLPQVGELITGTVIDASKREVLLDVEGLTTGIVRGKELYNESEEFSGLETGDKVEATVMEMENEDGMIELSFRYAGHQKAWATLQELQEKEDIAPAKILDANKGGLIVKVNHIQGFLPVSQLNPEHYPRIQGGDKNKILERLKSYVGQTFDVKVLDANDQQDKLIVSESGLGRKPSRYLGPIQCRRRDRRQHYRHHGFRYFREIRREPGRPGSYFRIGLAAYR